MSPMQVVIDAAEVRLANLQDMTRRRGHVGREAQAEMAELAEALRQVKTTLGMEHRA